MHGDRGPGFNCAAALLAAAMVIAALATTAAGSTPASAPVPDYFGLNVNGVFSTAPWPYAVPLDAASAAGATHGRFDLTWSVIEPSPPNEGIHAYNWSMSRTQVTAMAQAQIRPAPILCYCAVWASTTNPEKAPPRSDSDFAAFAAAPGPRVRAGRCVLG